MRLTDKCSTFEFSCGLQKKNEYFVCSAVKQCSANITSWQLVRIILKQKWIKLQINIMSIWKSLLKIGLFSRWNWFEVPFYGLLTMKIPIQAVRDTTLRTPWSKPPIVSPTSYHISPPAVFTEYKMYIQLAEAQCSQGMCTDQRRSHDFFKNPHTR